MGPQPWIVIASVVIIQICVAVAVAVAVAASDEVVNLPGQPPVGFKQHAGYITVDQTQHRALFYYFVEAEPDPHLTAPKPLVLWLNGGPGCSSVGVGAFCEHGPFKPSGHILLKNEHSWNKEANMLYLESPAGVGFSYSADKSFYDSIDDHITARDNLVFLQRWFDKYPQYKGRDFYITGESYAGHYVPQLAQQVLNSQVKFNLKGIAMGNPLLEFNTDFNSRAEFMWSHGLISDATYQIFTTACNYSQIRRQIQYGSLTPVCARVWRQVSAELSKFIDVYDITLDICLPSVKSQAMMLNQLQSEEKIDVCVEDETIKYLNRKDVQKALNARLVGISGWAVCSKYNMQNLEVPMTKIVGELVKSGLRVLVYSGDQDSILPLIGTRTVVNGVAKELGLETTVPYRAWFQGRQVGGWTQVYGQNLTFATIRGASHEAPFSQPARSLEMFSAFLRGNSLPQEMGFTQKLHD